MDDAGFIDEMKKDYHKLPTEEEIRKDKEKKFLDGLKKIDENDDAKRFAKDNGYYIGSYRFITFLEILIGVLIIIILLGALVGGYYFLSYVNDGKFQSIDNSSCICEKDEFLCPSIPSCPEQKCENSCNFPSELNIRMVNES